MNNHAMTTPHASNAPVSHTLDDLARIEGSINSTPVPQRPLSTAAALAALAPVLNKARERGHSPASLAQLCQQQGLRVSERAVSRAITAARASKVVRKKPTVGVQSSN